MIGKSAATKTANLACNARRATGRSHQRFTRTPDLDIRIANTIDPIANKISGLKLLTEKFMITNS